MTIRRTFRQHTGGAMRKRDRPGLIDGFTRSSRRLEKQSTDRLLFKTGDKAITLSDLFPINAAIQSFKQLCSSDTEGVADSEQSRYRNGSAGLNLLPMSGGKAKSNHILLGEAARFAQLLYPFAEAQKKLFLIDQACLLGDSRARSPRAD